jgi:UDP-N-acetylmuramoyl-L-alanyl-D-glutamate--2,6-diaminopimelate ligase
MTLRELIAGIPFDGAELPEELETEIGDLAYRAEDVAPGTLFFCVRGFTADGHDFAGDAVGRGAAALVCERPLGLGVPEVLVPAVRAAMPALAASFFGHPSSELEVAGITGTNGKTTTAFLLRDILEASGCRSGLLGTVQSVVGGTVEEVERTTPEAIDLQRTLRRMVDAGDRACVMEVSSHALELCRADAIEFDCGVFTNLTQDHLDFHGTLESYFEAKRLLFASSSPPRTSVVNIDDEWGRKLAAELVRLGEAGLVTFGVDQDRAEYRAHSIQAGATGSRFGLDTPDGPIEVDLPLPGRFNVYNALAAIAAAGSLGVGAQAAAQALRDARGVPGRFEPIEEGQRFAVLVDYAHTPDSLANVLRAGRELLGRDGDGRLICVFGAGGDRDREKRPLMGETARRLADHVIVTSDNPRSEDPQAIIAAIVRGAEQAAAGEPERSALEVQPDRRGAIAMALGLARGEDVVVIAGKGHEQGQEFADGVKIPFDDREVAREELRALKASPARPTA